VWRHIGLIASRNIWVAAGACDALAPWSKG
jgi:hypothetical protein